ncbi:MAG: cellulose biosynthesis cyclic di-GMP-binding regulatory protein BcsB [Paracoccus sp. (in: a-proteobacteria)]|uniref:cellulose biosynthesis cyclic di-GMP-binding regulatory protein BcsB n=1 Tax=Paracoccus sp. TaxID=267 RepID=UPI0039E483BB
MSPPRLVPLLAALLSPLAAPAQEIVLPAPAAEAAAEAAPAAGSPPAAVIGVAPAIRDGAAESVPSGPDPARLSGLSPLALLPEGTRMGASLPQPGILRLTGEVAAITLALDLPEDAPLPQGLRLALRSAINVLPETALMQVAVNDAAPLDLPLRNFGDFRPVDLPAAGLVAGPNRIRIALRQPHRIFCGPDASFGVWTELDLARSGAVLAGSVPAASAEGFARALAQQVRSGLPLTVLADAEADPAALRGLTDALGKAMLGQAFLQIRSPYDMGARAGISVMLAGAARPGLSYRLDGRGAPVMVVAQAGGRLPDMSEAMRAITLPASDAGAALPLPPGQPVTLAQLGQGDIVGNTHYFRQDIRFLLPGDWLLLANQKARLDLHYGHADNLPQGAILLVKVNDRTVRLLPLDRDGGKLLEPLKVGFAARLLHPGENRLSFEMMVPGNPPDIACPPLKTDMLVIARDSSLTVPNAPAMRLPGLSEPLAGLTAAGVRPDPQAAQPARMRLAAIQLAASLRPAAQPDPAASLLVTDFSAMPGALADVSQRALQQALFPAHAPETAAASAPAFRLTEAEAPAARPSSSWSPLAWLDRQRERLRNSAFLASGESLSDWLEGRRGDALLIGMDRDQPQALALILGPEAQMRGMARALAALRDGGQGHGGAALLSNDGGWQLWTPVRMPRLEGPVTAANLFPILGNYASWSPLLFACALLGLGILSVLPALAVVLIYRKRRLR